MAPIEVFPVSSRRERNAFIKFPWQIYRSDPAWVPPLIIERKAFLNRRKHPFFQHGDAQFFLARRGKELVGRIMACDDPRYNAEHQANVGCFGLFECVDDMEVARALFAAAEEWVRRKGRDLMLGPIDYSTNYVCALLIEGFEHPPTILTAHNPPYYRRLIEACGFEKEIDWYAWWFADPANAVRRLRRIAGRFNPETVTIRSGRLNEIKEESRRLREVYNQAWEKNWGFVPFTEAEFEHMRKEMQPLLIPDLLWLAEAGTDPAGFILALPDVNVILRDLNGRLTRFGFPSGLIRLLTGIKRLKTARLIALGVVDKYRLAGIAERLVLRIVEEGMLKRGLTGELSMTLENNDKINRFLEAIGANRYKTYRIFRRSL